MLQFFFPKIKSGTETKFKKKIIKKATVISFTWDLVTPLRETCWQVFTGKSSTDKDSLGSQNSTAACVPAMWEKMLSPQHNYSPHFLKYLEIHWPKEEWDVPEERPGLEKTYIEGKRDYFSVHGPNLFVFMTVVWPELMCSYRGGSGMVSPDTGVFMNLMHPLTNHQCLGMCLTQGSAKAV